MAVHALAQLIEEVQAQSDPPLTLNAIARRSGLSSSRVHQMVRKPMKAMPDPDTLHRLADALRVPLRQVVNACLDSLGLPSGQPAFGQGTVAELRRIVDTSTELTPGDRDTWSALIDSLERRQSETRRRQRPVFESTGAAEQAMSRPRPVESDEDRIAGLRALREQFAADTRHSVEWREAMVGQVDLLIAAAVAGNGDTRESDAL